jgi:hypothetical protein
MGGLFVAPASITDFEYGVGWYKTVIACADGTNNNPIAKIADSVLRRFIIHLFVVEGT